MKARAPLLRWGSLRGAAIAGIRRGVRRHDGGVLAEDLHSGEDEGGRLEEEGGTVSALGGASALLSPNPSLCTSPWPPRVVRWSHEFVPADVSMEDGGGGRSAEDVYVFVPLLVSLLMEEVIKGPMTCPDAVSSHFASCSSAGDVVGGGCGAAKYPLHWKFALLRILRKVPKSRRTRVRECCRARGQEDEEEGRWEVLGRGGAQLLRHLGSGFVRFVMREENTMLLIAKFVVDASYCSILWQNPGRVTTWSAHDFATGSRSASRPRSSPWSLATCSTMRRLGMVHAEVVQADVPRTKPDRQCALTHWIVQEFVLAFFFLGASRRHSSLLCTRLAVRLGTLYGLRGGFWRRCVTRSSHL